MSNFSQAAMDHYPLVTIMIPTYKQKEFIEQCVRSALDQTYPALEVIISDDSPDDETSQLLSSYSSIPNLRYHRNSENLGRLGNYRKLLFEYAKGDYVLMLDGDDYLLDPDYIKKAVDVILKYPSVVYVRARHTRELVHHRTKHSESPEYKIVSGPKYSGNVKSFLSTFSHLSSLYNRSLAINGQFYKHNDAFGFFLLAQQGDVCLLDTIAGVWRKTGTNASESLDMEALEGVFGMADDLKKQKILTEKAVYRMRIYYFLNYLSILKSDYNSGKKDTKHLLRQITHNEKVRLRTLYIPGIMLLSIPDNTFNLIIKVLLKLI